jgi:hypothetical protein
MKFTIEVEAHQKHDSHNRNTNACIELKQCERKGICDILSDTLSFVTSAQ